MTRNYSFALFSALLASTALVSVAQAAPKAVATPAKTTKMMPKKTGTKMMPKKATSKMTAKKSTSKMVPVKKTTSTSKMSSSKMSSSKMAPTKK